jgi:hypothetical protein
MWVDDQINLFSDVNILVEPIVIDEINSCITISKSSQTGKLTYSSTYYLDLEGGKANLWVGIDSNLPFYTTADLLRTTHVEV